MEEEEANMRNGRERGRQRVPPLGYGSKKRLPDRYQGQNGFNNAELSTKYRK